MLEVCLVRGRGVYVPSLGEAVCKEHLFRDMCKPPRLEGVPADEPDIQGPRDTLPVQCLGESLWRPFSLDN